MTLIVTSNLCPYRYTAVSLSIPHVYR